MICGDKNELVYHFISECCKLKQKENKTRHDWVEKVIHEELYKKLKFDIRTNAIYIYIYTPLAQNMTQGQFSRGV